MAEIYGVSTRRLNEQVKRNVDRFPSDFVFRITRQELAELKSKFAISNCEDPDFQYDGALKSQFATSKAVAAEHYLSHLVNTVH